MKFVILNQPTKNKGDLAAFKALVSLISKKYPSAIIECIFTTKDHDLLFDRVENVNCIDFDLPNLWRLTKTCLKYPFLFKLLQFLPGYSGYTKHIKSADIAVLAPGGLEIGAYQDWRVLWSLALADAFGVKYAIYSRSIGKFVNETKDDQLFIKFAIKYLKGSKFNGLRERKSQELASMLGLNYFPAIDVVYSYIPEKDFNSELIKGVVDDYVVFVPSKFDNWHPDFNDESQALLDKLYRSIISMVINKGKTVVMLPHTYGRGVNRDDRYYFETLIEDRFKSNCIIVDDQLDTDDYQAILKRADFSISARLHQVIFSINNHTPVLCLSYEHKMQAMMEMLGLSKYSLSLQSLIKENEKLLLLLEEFLSAPEINKDKFINAQKQAGIIAIESFNNFVESVESK
ncbi:polysaccharide pyruvyl transferase family protein [Thalassotalea piscium]